MALALSVRGLDVLRKPPDALTVSLKAWSADVRYMAMLLLTLSHNDAAHENLDRPDALERHLALACRLI